MKPFFIWQDKRSLNYLLSLFIFSLGSFIINPYYAIYVSDNLGYGVAFAGLLVSVKVISQRVFALIGGSMADIFPAVYAAQAGVVVRALSFALLALNANREILIISAVLNGIGGALFNPAIRKLLFTRYKEDNGKLKQVIAWRNAAFNLGAAIGPLIGVFLINLDFKNACIAITLIHIVVGAMLMGARTAQQATPIEAGGRSLFVELTASLLNRALFPIFVLQFFFMYFYSHIEYLLPIFIAQQHSEYFVSIVFFVNTLFVIVAQTIFSRVFNELRAGVAWGMILLFFIALALLAIFPKTNPLLYGTIIVLGVMAFSASEVILSIQVDYIATLVGGHHNSGTIFGAISLVAAGGLFVANLINSTILEYFGFTAVWLVNMAIAAGLGGFALYRYYFSRTLAYSR
jgi:MFS family permease